MMSRDDEKQHDAEASGSDLGSGDRLVGRWGRSVGVEAGRAGVAIVGAQGKKLDGRTRAARALRAGRSATVRNEPAADRDEAGLQTPTPEADGTRAPLLPTATTSHTGGAGGVRFPAIRSGTGGRKQQYGDAELGVRLRIWRERSQFSQTDLALRVGVSSPNISHYERGTRAPSKEVCKRLRILLCLTDAEYIQLLEWS